jgi:hypothetical protein
MANRVSYQSDWLARIYDYFIDKGKVDEDARLMCDVAVRLALGHRKKDICAALHVTPAGLRVMTKELRVMAEGNARARRRA